MDNQLPEVVKEEKAKVDSIFMRTVLRKDIYERLRGIAQRYSTGQGHWDFGVAIQFLLDFYDEAQRVSTVKEQDEKINLILNLLTNKQEEETPKEEEMIELLGGEKITKT